MPHISLNKDLYGITSLLDYRKQAAANGATDMEIHDAVLIAALFCFYNRYVDGLATATPPDPAFYEALAKRITGRGYTMPADGYHPLKFNQTN